MSLFNRKTFIDGDISSLNVQSIVHGSVKNFIGDLTGANQAADAAKEGARLGAEATLASTEKNIDFQKWLWGEQKSLSQPFVDMGMGAIPEYQRRVNQGMTVDEMYKDPGYQFGLNEGTKARENSAGAKGMQLSGASQKALNRFGVDYGSTKYNEAFNRRQVGLDNLYRMIVSGQAGAAGQAQQGGAMGAQVSSSINTAGQATAGMYQDIGNIEAGRQMSPFNTALDVGNMVSNFYSPSPKPA